MRKIESKQIRAANAVIWKSPELTEVVCYKRTFLYATGRDVLCDEETGEAFKTEFGRARKFMRDAAGVLRPLTDSATIDDLKRSIRQSGKRSKQNFFAYARANKWRYFVTFTVPVPEGGKEDDAFMKECWWNFGRNLKRACKGVKILCSPERFKKSGQFHFHALIGNADLDYFLHPAFHPRTKKPLFTKLGNRIFNLPLWKYGFTTAVKIAPDCTSDHLAAYLSKYLTKTDNIGYNQKRYYRTANLDFCNKEIVCLLPDEISALLEGCASDGKPVVQAKDNDKLTVFRIYNAPAGAQKAHREPDKPNEPTQQPHSRDPDTHRRAENLFRPFDG